MKSFSFLLLVSFLVFSLTSPFARAENCEATQAVIPVARVPIIRLFKGTGNERRSPTLKEVFDAMNAKGSTLFEDLKNPNGEIDIPRTFVEVPDLKQPGYLMNFNTLPSPKIRDYPACKVVKDRAGKVVERTGYQCRVDDLRSKPEAEGLPKGLETGVKIQIPKARRDLIKSISTALGCDELLYENGQPVLAAPGSGKRHAPTEKTATTP